MLSLFLLAVVSMVTFGCAGGPKYNVVDNFVVPKDAKIGVLEQRSCAVKRTEEGNPKLYTESLRAQLEKRLQKPVLLVQTGDGFDYSAEKTAEAGKKTGVDFVVGGRLAAYKDPSNA